MDKEILTLPSPRSFSLPIKPRRVTRLIERGASRATDRSNRPSSPLSPSSRKDVITFELRFPPMLRTKVPNFPEFSSQRGTWLVRGRKYRKIGRSNKV